MGFDINFMFIALKAALKYTPVTLVLAIVPLVIGILFGTIIAVVRIFKVKILGKLSQILVVIIRGIPMVLLLLMIYFEVTRGFDVLAVKFNWKIRSKDIDLIYVAIIALSISAIANISEVIRGALVSVGKGQFEAAYSVGLTKRQTLRRIILPQALPVAVPTLCSSLIGLIKGSSLAYMVTVVDLMNGALITATANYRFLEAYIAAAIVYWVLCIGIEKFSFVLEKRLNVYTREGVL